ncbi:YggS family pyridoxal phosphate-dependent enzyme [Moraxella sp. ZJ142]|uniref:YggS family pyridoxal phosphate-dependent enzyme n=1 Tax=Moraxella marmotae TaxID=3344520 RepID=UPI0035D3E064
MDFDKNLLIANYQAVKQQLDTANHVANRTQPASLLAVSKTKPAAMIAALFELGQRDFGENYLQEALGKMGELGDLPIVWHYIGSIQRNKTKDIAKHFDWVHTLERDIIAKRLNEQRAGLPPLNVLIQVNIDDEDSKSGCQPQDVPALIDAILACDNLRLRGLMVIPSKDGSDAFVRTKALFDEMAARYQLPSWDSISMGMSGDMAAAVTHGSTMVRVGTAIFGSRNYD